MSDIVEPTTPAPTADPAVAAPQTPAAPTHSAATTPYAAAPVTGAPTGQIRSTGMCILLAIVTLGIYSWIWYFKTHDEMKRHSGTGLGGGLALVLAIFVGVAMPFITSNEVGELYGRAGKAKPVSVATGLWYLPGMFILVGPIVWFVKTNGALNEYWRSQGVAA